MSLHIEARDGEIADRILLPGDPLRAKYIAETFLEGARCFNRVRNILGYTGTYKGQRVSVMGTGMGIPSISIYVHELLESYGVKTLIRVGTCGAMREDIQLRDVLIAQGLRPIHPLSAIFSARLSTMLLWLILICSARPMKKPEPTTFPSASAISYR